MLTQDAANPETGSSKTNGAEKFVVDTNVLISAILYGGKPEVVLHTILSNQQLVLSDYIVDEIIAVIKELQPRVSQRWIRHLRQKLALFCRDDTVELVSDIRDINDLAILKLAVAEQAVIISDDKDLLEYKSDAKMPILSVAEYLEIFGV